MNDLTSHALFKMIIRPKLPGLEQTAETETRQDATTRDAALMPMLV